jgi:hypothetical protein
VSGARSPMSQAMANAARTGQVVSIMSPRR